jgi:uncharacterized protein (TIGR00375 family)
MIKDDWMISDLHIHSRFSRACSKDLNFDNLVKWAKIKGLNLLGTGDFTHPVWLEEIKNNLLDNGKGFYLHESGFPFIITGEVSLIYTQGKGRRVHLVLLVPSIEIAEKINSYLDNKGRRDYDGRPIFKISCEDFVRNLKSISENIEIIPAHIWTPWFGIFGSMSGFDSLKEAFGNQFEKIYSIETGISSDPPMNWKIKDLQEKAILSFSDAHSFWPFRLGREATIFKKCDSYLELIKQIRKNDFIGTIETDPAYGKYHFDGHRNCNFSCNSGRTIELEGKCPKCGKSLIVGVENRVERLSDVEANNYPNKKTFYTLLPLHELIALFTGKNMQTKSVWDIYNKLINNLENEFNILLNVPEGNFIEKGFDKKLIDLIFLNRKGKINVKPGYDGVYGEALIGSKEEQKKLF